MNSIMRKPLGLLTGVLACLAVTVLAACKEEAKSVQAPPLPSVEVVTISTQTVPDEPEFIGQAEASRIVEIRSQVTGIIKERFFAEGRDVKKGDRLYQIDPVPFRAAHLSAQAKVTQAEARLVQAKQNYDRVRPLLAEQAVSQKDVDDAVAEQLAAKGALEAAKGDLVKAKFDLDNTSIIAPIEGLIERTRYYEGRLVTAQTDLLTVIHQVDPMYVIVSAPESFLLKRRRDTISKLIQHPGIYQLTGKITFVDGTTYAHEGALDFADVGLRTETGSRQARVVFPNPDRVLLPGQFVTVRFHGVSKPNVILVSQRAVQQGPNGPVVYVIGEGDKVEVRDVKAANWRGDQWLIEEGLHPGERIMMDGFQRVMPGAVVKPVMASGVATKETAPTAASAKTNETGGIKAENSKAEDTKVEEKKADATK
ncbi:MAG TPA: efflux RND transporter periplasmic adaptor subunit [Nitrospira sp.]